MKRNSFIVKLGRLYQHLSVIFCLFDWLIVRLKRSPRHDIPKLFIIAPPRSGSTLTYQLLVSGFNNFHLTNMWNLMFATPFIGGWLAKKVKHEKSLSNFQSVKGFVPGLNGEAEGLKFWSFWLGQGLFERDITIRNWRLKHINKVFNILGGKTNTPFISGYLGHSLCIDQLRRNFKKSLFIFLTRDFYSNALSLYYSSTKQGFSIRTNEMLNSQNRYEEITLQLKSIYKKMESDISDDTFVCSYEQICQSPIEVLYQIQHFAAQRGINLELKNENAIPRQFKRKEIDENDYLVKKFSEYFSKYKLETNLG